MLLALSLVAGCGPHVGARPRPVPLEEGRANLVPDYEGQPHTAAPLPPMVLPTHPYMADGGRCCMHADPLSTDTYLRGGPLGVEPEVSTKAVGWVGGECASVQFDGHGRAVTVCIKYRRPYLLLLDPTELVVLAKHRLPQREGGLASVREMLDDTSGGAYFYLDEQDRVIVGTSAGTVDTVAIEEDGFGEPHFRLVSSANIRPSLRLDAERQDKVTSVMPDWDGNVWYAARYGTIGTVTREGVPREAIRLEGEEIENSFSVGPDGVYIVSDHALYRLRADEDGKPHVLWREPYDRGSRRKVGQINQGSGTTPTLLGDDYVAIADNAEPRLNVLVYRRGDDIEDRLVCTVPLFGEGESATENTFIGYGRSLIVENNAGYDIFRTMRGGRTGAGGLARVDVREDGSGCDRVWESDEISQTTVPKLSLQNGLIYLYTKRPDAPFDVDAYYFTAIDYRTGETIYRVLTGVGISFDNNWAAISLAPDGSAFVGIVNGLARIRDRVADPESLWGLRRP